MSIYLYIKQHTITGKLYFGKTVKTDPVKYLGSGKHWKRHIKLHGKEHVVTLWYCLFLDQESCTQFALRFSEQQNIVESDDWLNLMLENGKDGGYNSASHSAEANEKRKDWTTNNNPMHNPQVVAKFNFTKTDEHKSNIGKSNLGKHSKPIHSQKQKEIYSEMMSGENNPMFGKSAVKGRKWYNNGLVSAYILPSENIPNGFIAGRLKLSSTH